MIPLRDANPTRSRPYVVYTLIAINALVWLFEVGLGEVGAQALVQRFGVVPGMLTGKALQGGDLEALITPFTSMFLHGGWMHVIGNMWFLWVFGDNVEDVLGKARFVLFYVLGGLGAVAAQVLVDPSSPVPMVGASGAISAVMAGYVLLFPRARVLTLIPIVIIFQLVEVPAFLFIFVWFGLQLLNGWLSLGLGDGGGVAWFAHIGGFLAGLALIRLLRPRGPDRTALPRPRVDDSWPREGHRWRRGPYH